MIANHEKFAVLSERAENSLRNESWDHSVVESMEPIHVSEDKVHLSIKSHQVTGAAISSIASRLYGLSP